MSFSIYMITGQKRNLADVLRSLATMIQETNNQRVSINLNLTFETDPEPKPKPLQQGLQPFPNPPTLPKPEPNVSKKKTCWTPERRRAQAERMKRNHIRKDSVVKPSIKPVLAAAPSSQAAAEPDLSSYKSPNGLWKSAEAPPA